jgi:hypothetical protein
LIPSHNSRAILTTASCAVNVWRITLAPAGVTLHDVDMSRGLSVHIGLNSVDPSHYVDGDGKPWEGRLNACENDARDLAALAGELGYQVGAPILTKDATSTAVIGAIRAASRTLQPGDTLLLTYSGHGGQVANTNPDDDPETDDLDETWCLYDRELLDDELFALFAEFGPGVRVVVLADCCHSGTVTRGDPSVASTTGDDAASPKQLPVDVAEATERHNADLYQQLQDEIPSKRMSSMGAAVALLSGCQDDQFSRDGRTNGAFTGALLEAWSDAPNRRSLHHLLEATVAAIPKRYQQTPNFVLYAFDIGPALAF